MFENSVTLLNYNFTEKNLHQVCSWR